MNATKALILPAIADWIIHKLPSETSVKIKIGICDKRIQLKSELLATEFCEIPEENQPEIRTELSEIERFTVKWIQESSGTFKKLLVLYADLMFN